MVKVVNRYKIILLTAIVCLIVALTSACSSNIVQANPKNEEAHNAYNAVIEECNALKAKVAAAGGTFSFSLYNPSDYKYISLNDMEIPTKYAYLDLDNDGIDELIVSCDEYIINIFSYVNDAVTRTIMGMARDRYYIGNDNILINEGSGGAAYGNLSAYNYCVNEQTEIKQNNCVSTIESYSWEPQGTKNLLLEHTIDNNTTTSTIQNTELQQINKDFENRYPKNSAVAWFSI